VRALPRRRPMCRPLTPCSIHLDHQDDPVPLLPQRPAAAPGAGERRAGPEPAIPRLARGPGQPSGELLTRTTPRAALPRHTLMRLAAARVAATGASQARPGRQGEGDQLSTTCRRASSPRRTNWELTGHPPDAP